MEKEVYRKSQQPNVESKNSFHDSIILFLCYSINQLINQSINRKGRLRNPSTQTPYTPGTEPDLFLGRGYTGHEHLTWFGLINMNARLYDPAVGRFLSPDPFVQAPDNTQSFNRYSYCLNNPLKYTDPSGSIYYYQGSDGKWTWQRDEWRLNRPNPNGFDDFFGYNFNNNHWNKNYGSNTIGGWGGGSGAAWGWSRSGGWFWNDYGGGQFYLSRSDFWKNVNGGVTTGGDGALFRRIGDFFSTLFSLRSKAGYTGMHST